MSAPSFITFEDWREMSDFQKLVVKSLLGVQLKAVLGKGEHTFDTVPELLDRVGVEHLTTGQIMMRNMCMKNFRTGVGECLFKMSIRRFASLVHGMDGVRIEQFSHEAVARDGMPRIRLIIS